ncbi:hypothetical protein BGZ75_001192, partial [Mortierella antarctica]
MILCGTILRTHYGSVSTPGSLGFIISMLERKRLGQEMSNFHTADELIRHTFDAMVRRMWETEFQLDGNSMDMYQCGLESYGKSQSIDDLGDKISKGATAIAEMCDMDAEEFAKERGIANANAILFLRDTIVYIELGAAIKEGDVGRIKDVLERITVMFQAGGTKNYAKELLRLTYGLRHAWSEERTAAIMSSWLINTKGKAGSWIPADLYQEHNNLLTKTIHAAKGSNMSWDVLARSISTNVRLFSKLNSIFDAQYSLNHNNSRHSPVAPHIDIGRIIAHLRNYNILGNGPCLVHIGVPLVKDLFCEGFERLAAGRFEAFVDDLTSDEDMECVLDDFAMEDEQEKEYIGSCFPENLQKDGSDGDEWAEDGDA